MRNAAASRSGFTLIELSRGYLHHRYPSVDALPALRKAKQAYGQMPEQPNQIGIGLKLYVDDNQETFPPQTSIRSTGCQTTITVTTLAASMGPVQSSIPVIIPIFLLRRIDC
jgi:hypothetical protein